jgi:hypothetical protein
MSASQLSSPWSDGQGYGGGGPPSFIPKLFKQRLIFSLPVVEDLAYAFGLQYMCWTIMSRMNMRPKMRHCVAETTTEVRAGM